MPWRRFRATGSGYPAVLPRRASHSAASLAVLEGQAPPGEGPVTAGGRSTGVFVLYADQESFTLMTPQGHMFAGWVTFSAEQADEATIVRAHALMCANGPLYELGMTFGGHAKEDRFWAQILTALGTRLGVPDPQAGTRSTCVDSHR